MILYARIWMILVATSLIPTKAYCSLFPLKNNVVSVGSTTYLNCCCSSYDKFSWDYYQPGSNDIDTAVFNGKVNPNRSERFNVNKSENVNSILWITNVQFAEAGVYKCESEVDPNETFSGTAAILAVVGDDVHCLTNTSLSQNSSLENYVELSCSFNYSGNWIPRMQCQETSLTDETSHNWTDFRRSQFLNDTSLYNSVTFSGIMKESTSQRRMNYTCHIYFNGTLPAALRSTTIFPTNEPVYSFTWSPPAPESPINAQTESIFQLKTVISLAVSVGAIIFVLVFALVSILHSNKRKRNCQIRLKPDVVQDAESTARNAESEYPSHYDEIDRLAHTRNEHHVAQTHSNRRVTNEPITTNKVNNSIQQEVNSSAAAAATDGNTIDNEVEQSQYADLAVVTRPHRRTQNSAAAAVNRPNRPVEPLAIYASIDHRIVIPPPRGQAPQKRWRKTKK